MLKKTRVKLYNTVGLRALLCGIENWTIKAREARITAAQMKYRRKTAEYTCNIKQKLQKIKHNHSFGHNTGI
jgi:hypothetical protein